MLAWLLGIAAGLLAADLIGRVFQKFKAANAQIEADVEELRRTDSQTSAGQSFPMG